MRPPTFIPAIIFAALLPLAAQGAATQPDYLGEQTVLPVHDRRDAYEPAAVFVKDAYLVAWQSGRLAPGDLRKGFRFHGDIVACRVSRTGQALSAQPVVICGADDLQERPRAAANADVALFVWQDLRNGKDWDVYAARVSPEGKVLDPAGLLIRGGPHNQANPRLAWDGNSFVVVWQDFRDGKYEIRAARVSPDGKVLDPAGVQLSSSASPCYDPAVASAGDGSSFVTWNCGYGFGGKIVAEGRFFVKGKPTETPWQEPQATNSLFAQPGVRGNTPLFLAAGKDAYLLAWRNFHPIGRGDGGASANAYVFNAKGAPAAAVTLCGQPHKIIAADIAWDGTAFVAAWSEMRTLDNRFQPPYEHVFVSRIAPDGKQAGHFRLIAGSKTAGSPSWDYPVPGDKRRWTYSGPQYGQAAAAGANVPAANPTVASDGAGTSLIAYEKHPADGKTPIAIGLRILRAADASGAR